MPGTALHELANESPSVLIDQSVNVFSVVVDGVLAARQKSTISAWTCCNFDMIGFLYKLIPFVRTNFLTSLGDPMVGPIKADNPILSRMDLSHLHSKIIGLRARISKSNNTELRRESFQ